MNFPTLPTYNLYIFFTLSGIVLVVFAMNQVSKFTDTLSTKIYEIRRTKSANEVNMKNLEWKIETQTILIKLWQKAIKKKYEILDEKSSLKDDIENYIWSDQISNEDVDSLINSYSQILESTNVKLEEERMLKISIAQNDIDKQEYDRLQKYYVSLGKLYRVLVVIGFVMALIGFINWYFRNQFYQDEIIKQEYHKGIVTKDSVEHCNN